MRDSSANLFKPGRRVPFYENTPDNLHCFQAVLRMILKYFEPEEEFSWENLEEISQRRPNGYTWGTAAMLWLHRRGYEIRDVGLFDSKKFTEIGAPYMIEFHGETAGRDQIANSDIDHEVRLAKEALVEIGQSPLSIPTLETFRQFKREGFLTFTLVNSAALINQPGYCGHFVLILDADHEWVKIHNPGLPGYENQRVRISTFEKAWAHSTEKSKNLTAVRHTKA